MSDHFRDGRFFNPHDPSPHGFSQLLKWRRTRTAPPPWKDQPVTPVKPPPRVQGPELRATFVGHSTVLIQWEGLNLLTDPVWADRASPLDFAGPRRFSPPGVKMEDLPPIDAVILSHNHYDHLDEAAVKALKARHNPQFFVPLGVAEWFRRRGMSRVVELDWWQSSPFLGFTFHAVPVQHFSGRGPFDNNTTLWVGWVVETPSGRLFFAGDTGYSPDFAEIGRHFAPFRLALIPIGAYEPRWFMGPVHIDPAQAVQVHRDVGALQSLGIHFGTFPLADDPQDEPPRLLKETLIHQGLSLDSFVTLPPGGHLVVPPMEE